MMYGSQRSDLEHEAAKLEHQDGVHQSDRFSPKPLAPPFETFRQECILQANGYAKVAEGASATAGIEDGELCHC